MNNKTFTKKDIARWLKIADRVSLLKTNEIPEYNDITELLVAITLMSEYILQWSQYDQS